jgi:hypothetical protein
MHLQVLLACQIPFHAYCPEGLQTKVLSHACCQAHWITFQLTFGLAAYIQTADKPLRPPFSSLFGLQLPI